MWAVWWFEVLWKSWSAALVDLLLVFLAGLLLLLQLLPSSSWPSPTSSCLLLSFLFNLALITTGFSGEIWLDLWCCDELWCVMVLCSAELKLVLSEKEMAAGCSCYGSLLLSPLGCCCADSKVLLHAWVCCLPVWAACLLVLQIFSSVEAQVRLVWYYPHVVHSFGLPSGFCCCPASDIDLRLNCGKEQILHLAP